MRTASPRATGLQRRARGHAWDHRLDAFGSLAVLIGLAVAYWGGPAYEAADHIAALVVAAAVLWAGGSLLWDSVQELMDRQADPEIVDEVRREASAVAGVRGVEKVLARGSPAWNIWWISTWRLTRRPASARATPSGMRSKDRLMGRFPSR